MNIDGISFSPASRLMTNDDVLEEVKKNSKENFNGDIDQAIEYIRNVLQSTKLETRYWFADDEKPLDLIIKVVREAAEQAECRLEDIDLIMYTGNCRGFIEPADAYFIAHALGLKNVECFDVLDACMAWTRACDIAQSHLLTGRYKKILIVNSESYFEPGGFTYPSNFQLSSLRDVSHCLSAYCGGDGASATILSHDPDNEWEFNYISVIDEGVNLCTVPLPGYERRSLPNSHIGKNGLGCFTSYGSQVFSYADNAVECLEMLAPKRDQIKMLFPHTGGSIPEYQSWAERAGFGELIRYIYPQYGNLGSASLPASIFLHHSSGELKREDQFAIWSASSGLSFMSSSFRF